MSINTANTTTVPGQVSSIPYVKPGDKGEPVKELKAALTELHYSVTPGDIYDEQTQALVRDFKTRKFLGGGVDVGGSTWVALEKATGHPITHALTMAAKVESYSPLEKKLLAAGLVDVSTRPSGENIQFKSPYSTTQNFLGRDIYGPLGIRHLFLKPGAADKLVAAQAELRKINPHLSLLVLDGARPADAQRAMYEVVKGTANEALVAVPPMQEKDATTGQLVWKRGSAHNWGNAIDLTIVDDRTGMLDMGSPFDSFDLETKQFIPKATVQVEGKTEEWGREWCGPRNSTMLAQGILTAEQVQNRELLRQVMVKGGCEPYDFEWWHFYAVPKAQSREGDPI